MVRKIEEVPAADWDSLFPEILENHSFFRTLDESSFEQFSFYYLLVYEGNTLVGAAPCFLMNYPLDTTVEGILKSFSLRVKKIAPHLFSLKVLICGSPLGLGRIGFSERRPDIFEALCDCFEALAREEKIPIAAFKDFRRTDAFLMDGLSRRGFYKFENFPTTEMKIGFDSFDAYLKTLSRPSRDGLKRKLKKADKMPPLKLEVTGRLSGALDEVYALYLQTLHAHGEMTFETLPKDFFSRISENMPDQAKFFLWRADSKLVAFAFCLVSEDFFSDYYLGFDYSVAYDYHLYFIRFRDLMNWCIENKIKSYEMGPTNYEPKRRLGFGFISMFVYAKCRNPWLRPFFKLLCVTLKPDNFDPVFKWMKERRHEA